MAESTLQLQLPVLLPDVEDERDQCAQRLQEQITGQKGIYQAHVDRQNGTAALCLHYDPNLLSLEKVQRLKFGEFSFQFDLFNALNTNAATNISARSGPTYGRITAIVPPRIARLGVTYSF